MFGSVTGSNVINIFVEGLQKVSKCPLSKNVMTAFFPPTVGYSHEQVSFIGKSTSLGDVQLCEKCRVLQSNKAKPLKSNTES